MLCFSNPGILDPRLITTFGANVKTSDNPIGYFGTGLKYALAVLLRTGHEVKIQSGAATYRFGTSTVEIKSKALTFVTMQTDDGPHVELGFTTDLGKNWLVWMAYRELLCNALDEGGGVVESMAIPDQIPTQTTIIVQGREITEVYRNRHKYFLEGEPWFSSGPCEVFNRPSEFVYYRRVLVHVLPKPSLYTYNITSPIRLSEDRTADTWTVKDAMEKSIAAATNKDFLRAVLTSSDVSMESQANFSYEVISPTMKETVVDLAKNGQRFKVNPTAIAKVRALDTACLLPEPILLTDVEQATLVKALKFCSKLQFEIDQDKLVVTDSLGASILGCMTNGTIYIARRAFMQGTKTVAGTLIEEHLHLTQGIYDCTREMQNFLLDRLVSLGEELQGSPL